MFSLLCVVYSWTAESASILLDLANAGRVADDGLALAVAAGLAAVRVAALLLFALPAAWWLYKCLLKKDMRAPLIIIIVVSILFELWATPTRNADADAGSPDAAIAEQAEGSGG